MGTQKDLSLAYSPGVAEPCLEIAKESECAFSYINKGNIFACISNGTAVLGLDNIGALASKPVMEGKSVLFKKFADFNCVDLCNDAPDPDEFIECVKMLHPSFGGINLEDIKASTLRRSSRNVCQSLFFMMISMELRSFVSQDS